MFMALLTLTSLLMVWFSITAMLLGCLLVLPPNAVVVSHGVTGAWFLRFFRGGMGVWGTLRIGMAMGGVLWWYRMAGLPFSGGMGDASELVVGAALLMALFNAGRALPLPSGRATGLCSLLAIGWMIWFTLLLRAWVRN